MKGAIVVAVVVSNTFTLIHKYRSMNDLLILKCKEFSEIMLFNILAKTNFKTPKQ